jgi:hypothetical protein
MISCRGRRTDLTRERRRELLPEDSYTAPDPILLLRVVLPWPTRQELLNHLRGAQLVPLAVCLACPLLMQRRRCNLALFLLSLLKLTLGP